MKLAINVLAVLALGGGMLFGVTASSSATPATVRAAVNGLPSSCVVTTSSTSSSDLWSRIETCGTCTVVVYDTAALRDRAVTALAGLPPASSWAVIGTEWIATGRTNPGNEVGAGVCRFFLGGYLARLSG